MKHPIHRFGTYFLHGDGRPRPVRILEVGHAGRQEGKVHIEDTTRGRQRYWIAREHLSRNAKAPRISATERRAREEAVYLASRIKVQRG